MIKTTNLLKNMPLIKKQLIFKERIGNYSKVILIFSIIELVLFLLGKIDAAWSSILAFGLGLIFLIITTIPFLILGLYIIFKKFSKKYKIYCTVGLIITFLLWVFYIPIIFG